MAICHDTCSLTKKKQGLGQAIKSSLQIYVKYHKNVSCQKKLSEPLNSFCESLSGKEGADAMCLGSSKAFITDILLKYLKHMTHAC